MPIHNTDRSTVRLAAAAALAAMLFTTAQRTTAQADGPMHVHRSPAALVQTVREATAPLRDVNAAIAAGYAPFLGCVSGPEEGAMGVHYVNGPLVADGELDATRPEALIFETDKGRARLVGVEFIVDAAAWLARHDGPPVLDGQVFHYVGSPNRYALPAFFELHVWAWRENPKGAFADWNPHVSCEGQ